MNSPDPLPIPKPTRRNPGSSLSCPRFGLSSVFVTALFCLMATGSLASQESVWVRPQKPGDSLLWGRRDGIVFGLPSEAGIQGPTSMIRASPRGLLRVGVYVPGKSEPQLLNFIAIEPVVQGPGRRFDRLGFSELEMSEQDPGQRGKRLSVHPDDQADSQKKDFPDAGSLEKLQVGNAMVERLSVRIDVERYTENGAHVYLIASIDSDHPGELRLRVFAEKDSPPLEDLAVTATMGNYERLRQLWLKHEVEDSRTLFSTYTGNSFVEHQSYDLGEMLRTNDGDGIVFCTTDEPSPRDTQGNSTAHWPYVLPKVNQYWRVPGHDVEPDLRVRVNARRVYWNSDVPVLGGIAFENFEVRERYVPGQTFVFGVTQQEPMAFLHDYITTEMRSPTPPAQPATEPKQ